MNINIIAAVAANRAIGYQNDMVYFIREDLKRFKQLTTGHTVIMGRRTFHSLPKGALPDRRNIVLSRTATMFPGCEVYPSLDEALSHVSADEQVFIIGGATARLSQAALETLAVVAYRQPVTRGRVAQIRGVNVDGVMRTLHARGLIEEAGAETSGAILYRTTGEFLEYLGIDSLDELPPLAPYLPRVEALEEIVEQADEMAGRRTP